MQFDYNDCLIQYIYFVVTCTKDKQSIFFTLHITANIISIDIQSNKRLVLYKKKTMELGIMDKFTPIYEGLIS